MTIEKAFGMGISANEMSKTVTGSEEVSVSRSTIATGTGVALGAASSGALVVAGVAAAPIVAPVALVSGGVALIASLFD